MHQQPDALFEDLSSYDGLAVAADVAGLELMPENAEHADRLVAFAAAALAGAGAAAHDRDDLHRWLVDGPSLHGGPARDPYEGPFCEPVAFFGGGYLLHTGGDPEAVFDLRLVLHALFGRQSPFAGHPRIRAAATLARAVLTLSRHTCAVAGVRRYATAQNTEAVVIPNREELARLRAGVRYTREELRRLISAAPEVLDPLVLDIDAVPAPQHMSGDLQFAARPVLHRDGVYLVIEPGALAAALRHALTVMALDAGLRDAFVERLAMLALSRVSDGAERMGWRVEYQRPSRDGPVVSVIAGFDSDKAANITILYEDLEGYTDDPLALWDASRWEGVLLVQLRDVEDGLLLGPGDRPNEILHVVVLAGIGRPAVFGLPVGEPPLCGHQLLFSAENLDQITTMGQDVLGLWNYARASERLRTRCQVIAPGPLDEFAAWAEDESFYLGDDVAPTMVVFDGTFGRAFREKTARDTDIHVARTPARTWTEVVRIQQEPEIPIFAVLHDLGGQPRLLVEDADVDVWVQAPDQYQQPGHRGRHAEMVDCIAYWLWQCAPDLRDRIAASGLSPLVVAVELDSPDAWERPPIVGLPGPVARATPQDDGVLKLMVCPALMPELEGADNRGERALLTELLTGLDLLLSPDEPRGPVWVGEVLQRHAPLGAKKKINILDPDRDPAIVESDLPRFRRISRADTDELLDLAGEWIAAEYAPSIGPIEGEERVRVLNGVVGFHFSQLERELAQLSPVGLLESLVAQYEAAIRHEAVGRQTRDARAAAYGATRLVDEIRKSLPETTQVSVALRFLIEYTTARPPQGLRPVSVAVSDRLVAICGQIVSRGITSDVIHFDLDDVQLSMLVSGRLGLAEGAYQIGQQSFLDAVVPQQLRSASAGSGSATQAGAAEAAVTPEELDAAASAEWASR